MTLFVGASELVKATLTNSAQIWLDYPANLRNFQTKLATNPEQVDGNDLVKVLPPPLQGGVNNVAAVGRVVSFMKKYYIEEASCWRTGDLIAQVAPILVTAGALTIPKLALWLNKASGRLGRLVNLFGSEAYAKKLVDDLVEYPELVTSSGRKVEQTILKDADGNIENICEEVEDATTHERKTIKICGACLAAQTPVFGTGQTLTQLSQAQPVQTLETDGSIAWRQVLGKISRRVSQYVSVWVKGERIDASADHAFKTSQGWQPAAALRKGTLLVSLATASLLPIDSVAFVAQPLVVEGLALGNVAGYGVGQWGVLTAPSNGWCVRGLDLIGHQKFNVWVNSLNLSDAVVQSLISKLEASLGNLNGKNISDIVTQNVQGRYVIRTDARAIRESKVIAIERTSNGDYDVFEYTTAYLKGGEPGYPPLSLNQLAPDFSTNINGAWLHPRVINKQIRIKLTGARNGPNGDFATANRIAQIEDIVPSGKWKPDDYTWHHLDDFDPITGECTMQLVKTSEHVKTLPHSGSVAQWERYSGQTYLDYK